MSDTPDEESSGQSTGGQSQGGRQSGGQAQGGQAPGGQAGGGQAPAGQAAGGQYGGQQPQYNTGPGVGDIFSLPETMAEIKFGLVAFGLVGLGSGLGLLGISAGMGGSGFGAAMAAIGAISSLMAVPIAICSVLAYVIGVRQSDKLESQPGNIAYATAAVTSGLGSIVAFLLAALLTMAGAGAFGFGGVLLPLIMTAVGAAVISAGVVWANRSLLAPSRGVPAQQRQ